MKVGVALHYVRRRKITGVERFGLCLAAGLARLEISDVQFAVLSSAEAAKHVCADNALKVTGLPGDWRVFAEQCIIPVWTAIQKIELLHIPAFGGPFLHRTPFVLTIHDAVFWDMPSALSRLGRHYYRPLVERAIRSPYLRATTYPTVAARDAVLRHYPSLAPTAHVCSNATTFPRPHKPRRWEGRSDGALRVLTVGTIEPRKNLACMARSIERLAAQLNTQVTWQLVGRKGWASPQDEAVLRNPNVEWLGMVDDSTLLRLYQRADLYLSMSHLEGFNIPVVEAMSQGTPLVLSDLAVHREVAADAADYVDRDDWESAAARMHDILTAPSTWSHYSEAAWRRSQAFSPAALAKRVVDVYRAAS